MSFRQISAAGACARFSASFGLFLVFSLVSLCVNSQHAAAVLATWTGTEIHTSWTSLSLQNTNPVDLGVVTGAFIGSANGTVYGDYSHPVIADAFSFHPGSFDVKRSTAYKLTIDFIMPAPGTGVIGIGWGIPTGIAVKDKPHNGYFFLWDNYPDHYFPTSARQYGSSLGVVDGPGSFVGVPNYITGLPPGTDGRVHGMRIVKYSDSLAGGGRPNNLTYFFQQDSSTGADPRTAPVLSGDPALVSPDVYTLMVEAMDDAGTQNVKVMQGVSTLLDETFVDAEFMSATTVAVFSESRGSGYPGFGAGSIVPEPDTFMLACMGATGMGVFFVFGRRRRRLAYQPVRKVTRRAVPRTARCRVR